MPAVVPAALVAPRSPAVRVVATVFLRRRPLVVAPMFLALVITLALGDGPRTQVAVVAGFGAIALGFFTWEARRGARRLVSEAGLRASLVVTMLGIALAALATGAGASPLGFMLFAPTVIGFAAFGRGRTSNGLLLLAVALLAGLALVPGDLPFAPLAPGARRWLVVLCAADALVLLWLGVTALTQAHGAASRMAENAGDAAVASAAARSASLEAMGAKVAHEVRNPLSAIRGLIEVLAEKNPDERDRRRLGVMLGEVDRINQILTGYLSLARPLDQIQPVPTDLRGLLHEVAAVVEARAERAGVGLAVDSVAVTAPVDPQRLKEALLNLLLNAIDATPAGGRIDFQARLVANQVEIDVQDSGVGMPAAQLAKAGTPFSTGRAGGTGLGLALARQAIEQHAGTLTLVSQPGRGTLAQVNLPLVAPEAG